MPKCKSCSGDVLRTDAFCGICGEPVPGGKPVVPIARESNPGRVPSTADRRSGTFSQPTPAAAQAAAVVALSDPETTEAETGLNRTAIREREQSEPAPVLPLHRKKDGSVSQSTEQAETAQAEPRVSAPERDTSLPNIPVPPGPPILASDLLRERMEPRAPGEQALRRVTVVLGGVGLLAVLATGGIHPLMFVSLALLIGMLTLALTPLSYRGRAVSLFLMGSVATGVALWQQTLHGIAPEGIILALATILLGGSLLFRAYYRGARLGRVAVTIGVLALGAWFILSGGHESLVRLEGYWQSWAPASTHMAFGLLALLALMAFMDSSTRGGAHVWAYSLLSLYALHIALLVASQHLPIPGARPSITGSTTAAIVAGVVGTIVAGIALGQVLVVSYQAVGSRSKDPAA